jgi:hypothetical protein
MQAQPLAPIKGGPGLPARDGHGVRAGTSNLLLLDGSGCRLTSSILDVARNSDGEYRWPSRVAQTSLYSRALLDSELRSHSTSFWRKPADLVRLRCRMRLWLR